MVRCRFLNHAFGSSMRQLAEALRASELAALKASEIAGVIWLWVKMKDPKEPLQDKAMHQKNTAKNRYNGIPGRSIVFMFCFVLLFIQHVSGGNITCCINNKTKQNMKTIDLIYYYTTCSHTFKGRKERCKQTLPKWQPRLGTTEHCCWVCHTVTLW